MPTRRSLPFVVALLALVVLIAAGLAEARRITLEPNPADDPELIGKRLDPNRYDGAGRGCRSRTPSGTKQLRRWMKQNIKRKVFTGTIRCDGGVHSTGRALDFMIDARKRRQKRKAMRVINTWIERDRRGRPNALARRMGVQLIIFNCRFWQAGGRGLDTYGYCRGRKRSKLDPTQAHIDHIHVELTKPAARERTTFWRSSLAPGGGSGDGGSGGVGSGGVGSGN